MVEKIINHKRIKRLNKAEYKEGNVLYWLSRDLRAHDNWALLAAKDMAEARGVSLIVAYNLDPKFLGGGLRQFAYKQAVLTELADELGEFDIPLIVTVEPNSVAKLLEFINKENIGLLVTDFGPLKLNKKWQTQVSKSIKIPFYEVDAHNVVPCQIASDKAEFAAYTIRPKLNRLLPEFLTEFPKLTKQKFKSSIDAQLPNWEKVMAVSQPDPAVVPVKWLIPGEQAAKKHLNNFIKKRLTGYCENRNNPNQDALSDLSPYLHYGSISAQRVALDVKAANVPNEDKEAFLEELIIRRELADNFCFYHNDYDQVSCFHEWAQKTIAEHKSDPREYIYTLSEFESAQTHDPLWNAAQLQMVKTGKMHGYMRMYWAKKILEWTKNHQEALDVAIYLNDKYELDGRDPNGYAGIAWSIGGVHDRAWPERPIFGKIRYMNFNGCKRKFDVNKYIDQWTNRSQTSIFPK